MAGNRRGVGCGSPRKVPGPTQPGGLRGRLRWPVTPASPKPSPRDPTMPVARLLARPVATIAGLLLCLVAAPATLRAAPADSAPPLQWPDAALARPVTAGFDA